MRILILAPTRSDPAHRRVLSNLSREYRVLGARVDIFPPRDGLTPLKSRALLKMLLSDHPPDICHIQFFSRGLSYLSGIEFPSAMRVILTHQGASFQFMERLDVFQMLARRSDHITCVSRAGLREMTQLLPYTRGRSSWVHNGAINLLARSLRRPKRPFILSVGRLAAYKGTDILLMSFAPIASESNNIDLIICGPDQTQGRISRFVKALRLERRVRLRGDAPAAVVARLLKECLFFVLPSRNENFPMALLEAMSAGKAVVASAVGGVGEMIAPGKNGLLVAPNDVKSLTNAMRCLIHDRRLRTRLGSNAAKSAAFLNWASAAAGYWAIFTRNARRHAPKKR